MRLASTTRRRADIEVVVTSMLDVNFLLILFFIVTAHFQREGHAPLELPKEQGDRQAAPDESGLVINVTAAGQIIVSNRVVALEELGPMVKAEVDRSAGETQEQLKMMVRADRNAGSGQLNQVLVLLRELGVGTIRIATEVPAP